MPPLVRNVDTRDEWNFLREQTSDQQCCPVRRESHLSHTRTIKLLVCKRSKCTVSDYFLSPKLLFKIFQKKIIDVPPTLEVHHVCHRSQSVEDEASEDLNAELVQVFHPFAASFKAIVGGGREVGIL